MPLVGINLALLEITWHTMGDERVCPICGPLESATWTFDNKTDPFPRVLAHPTQGIVWDAERDEPRTHGSKPHNCRCRLTWRFDTSELTAELKEVKEKLKETLGEESEYGRVKPR